MDDSELKKRGIDYLLSQRSETIRPSEFTARELMNILKINSSSAHEHMARLVQEGKWGTRIAFDPRVHRDVRVWWFIE